ncbi:phosphotransferase [Saccharothrix longispora]|uniref:Streptomycin 6-kinase n=1 Tax=Saccharothrix longispora TaxID=33920 RepID=A0ABU1PWE2_9PSEU|nr:aminoglycoside phosphotransferase family protein [Saccharothrix longispora]MDR6594963.1 streptomycin 6-kinase [Saccharothrix longispora]
MDVDEITGRLALRFGPEVADWCAALPSRVEDLARAWGLVIGPDMPPGASSVVVSGTRDGLPVALKLSPDDAFLAGQTAALRHLAPSGRVPAVLAEAPGAALLAAVVPGTMAEELPVPPTPHEWAALAADLHGVPIPAGTWPDLRDRCEEAFTRVGRRLTDPAVAAHVTPESWDRARTRCRALLDSRPRVLLHGDLHLGNVLVGPRGLVAIDPRPCVGDPCFDVVDYVLDGARHEGVTARAAEVAAAASLDPGRLHAWARALAPMIALAHLDDEAARTELLNLAA